MKAIILAAGLSVKLDRDMLPKCLINIGQKTILERELGVLKEFGITDIVVVIGEKGGCWTESAKEKIRKMHDKVIVNKNNIETTSAYSLYLALKEIENDDVLVIDGDTLFEKSVIERLIKSLHANVMLTKKVSNPLEKLTRVVIKEDYIVRIGEEEKSDIVHTGIIKIGKELLEKLKDELSNQKYWSKSLAIPLNKLSDCNQIHSIFFGGDEVKEEILKTSPLSGGSYAQTKVVNKLINITRTVTRKEAYDEGREKLIDEINWLKNLPESLKPYFPTVLNYNLESTPVYFEMPYYELPTLRNLLIEKKIDSNKAIEILEGVINFIFNEMYSQYREKIGEDYLTSIHIKKTWKRFDEIKKKSKIISKIIDYEYIYINGKRYLNVPIILKKIERSKKLLRLLNPPFICKTHSDLHFDDILIDVSKTPPKFILIDPRGLDHTYSYEYDIGKLFFSFDGLYDFIHEGLFNLEMDFKGDHPSFVYDVKQGYVLEQYKKIKEGVLKILEEMPLLKNDRYWKERAKFTEAMLFLSNVPFQIRNDEIERSPIAQYITGTRLINEFWDWWTQSEEFKKEHEDIININTLEDYYYAKDQFE